MNLRILVLSKKIYINVQSNGKNRREIATLFNYRDLAFSLIFGYNRHHSNLRALSPILKAALSRNGASKQNMCKDCWDMISVTQLNFESCTNKGKHTLFRTATDSVKVLGNLKW